MNKRRYQRAPFLLKPPRRTGGASCLFRSIFCLSVVLLTGCATVPDATTPYNQTLPRAQRIQTLSQIKAWHINGAIAITHQDKHDSASVSWQQWPTYYTISFFGPLGVGGATLTGDAQDVTLTQNNGQTLKAKNPEALLQKALGWTLPVDALYYWIRGLSAPGSPKTTQLDTYNHLRILQQQGWTLHYLRYTGINGHDLPSLLTLQRDALFVKIVVSQWKI